MTSKFYVRTDGGNLILAFGARDAARLARKVHGTVVRPTTRPEREPEHVYAQPRVIR